MSSARKAVTKLKILKNHRAEHAAIVVELSAVSVIFMFKQFFLELFEGLGHTILFPLAAAAGLTRAILVWRGAQLEDYKTSAVLRAAVEVVAGLAIVTAVTGTFAMATAFVLAGPIIFTALLAMKTTYHLVAALFYGLSALLTGDLKDWEQVKLNALATVTNALSTVASGLVFVAHLLTFGVLGMAAAASAAGYAIYKLATMELDTASPVFKSSTASYLQQQPVKNFVSDLEENELAFLEPIPMKVNEVVEAHDNQWEESFSPSSLQYRSW